MANSTAKSERHRKHFGSSHALADWLASPAGELALQQDHRQLQAILPRLLGYRLLQIGRWGYANSLQGDKGLLCRWVVASDGHGDCDLVFDGEHLPVASRCLDAVVLPHSLEQAADPHRLLREVDRVLCDRGQLLLVGFNPWAPWTQWHRRVRRGLRYPARSLYPLGRIRDWMELLDYEVVHARRYAWGFPWVSRGELDLDSADWRRLPALVAPGYLIMARKRILTFNALRRPQRRRRVPAGVPEPSTRIGEARTAHPICSAPAQWQALTSVHSVAARKVGTAAPARYRNG